MTTLRERADSIAKSVFNALDATPTEDQAKAATDAIEIGRASCRERV